MRHDLLYIYIEHEQIQLPLMIYYIKLISIQFIARHRMDIHANTNQIGMTDWLLQHMVNMYLKAPKTPNTFSKGRFFLNFLKNSELIQPKQIRQDNHMNAFSSIMQKPKQQWQRFFQTYQEMITYNIKSNIKSFPLYTQFFYNLILKYSLPVEKMIQLIPVFTNNIEQSVYLEELIYYWKEFLESDLTTAKEKESLDRFLSLDTIEEGKVRSECTKNLPQFFADIIITLIRQYEQLPNTYDGRKAVRDTYPFINKLFGESQGENQCLPVSLETLKQVLDEIKSIDNLWTQVLNPVKIYQKIEDSQVKSKKYLRLYYVCWIPRLFEISQEKRGKKLTVWKYNYSKVKNGSIDKEAIQAERSIEKAGQYQKLWGETKSGIHQDGDDDHIGQDYVQRQQEPNCSTAEIPNQATNDSNKQVNPNGLIQEQVHTQNLQNDQLQQVKKVGKVKRLEKKLEQCRKYDTSLKESQNSRPVLFDLTESSSRLTEGQFKLFINQISANSPTQINDQTKYQKFLSCLIQHYFKALSQGKKVTDLLKAQPDQIMDEFIKEAKLNLEKSVFMGKITTKSKWIEFLASLSNLFLMTQRSNQNSIGTISSLIGIANVPPSAEIFDPNKNLENLENLENKKKLLIEDCMKNNVRSACTKNLAQFFVTKIYKLIEQKCEEVYGDTLQIVKTIWGKLNLEQKLNKIFQEFDIIFDSQEKYPSQFKYKPLLNVNKKEIKSLKEMWEFLGTKEIVHLWGDWGDIITEKKLYVKVKQSFKEGHIKACQRDYYYCFIPRLQKIVQKIKKNRSSPQKQEMKQQREEKMNIPKTKKITKDKRGKKYKKMTEQQKRQQEQREENLNAIGFEGHFWELNITEQQFSLAVSESMARQIEGRCEEVHPEDQRVINSEQQDQQVQRKEICQQPIQQQ